ncbi:hypothetical protein [Pseudochryseolinea flava]|uniref:hypothetical protein n=1 Tax=Pseudochryseolinea flava TaxID=2059302 RepID=UPI001C88CB4C|nr:hypothetical protein [Pseudochryseolinea flava]
MGLDMRPMGKPKPGFEDRFEEIYKMLSSNKIPPSSSKEDLLKEWFTGQIKT